MNISRAVRTRRISGKCIAVTAHRGASLIRSAAHWRSNPLSATLPPPFTCPPHPYFSLFLTGFHNPPAFSSVHPTCPATSSRLFSKEKDRVSRQERETRAGERARHSTYLSLARPSRERFFSSLSAHRCPSPPPLFPSSLSPTSPFPRYKFKTRIAERADVFSGLLEPPHR